MKDVINVVCLENCEVIYKTGKKCVHALDSISMTIRGTGMTGIMGPDGAGKTTLLRVLAGLLLPDNGGIKVYGKNPDQIKKEDPASIAYMPQQFGLYEDLSVEDNLNFAASLLQLPENKKNETIKRLLAFTNLGNFTKRLAGNLSGGMKQKLAIACATLGNPRLLLLDEPGVGVDPVSRRELHKMIGDLANNGMTVIWATSYLDEAAMFPELIILEHGKIIYQGAPKDLARRSDGSVYLVKSRTKGADKRKSLLKWTQVPGIIDVLIQGDFMRLEVGGSPAPYARSEIEHAGGEPVSPTLGDAYMAMMGGIDKNPSPFLAEPADSHNGPRVVASNLTKTFGSFIAADNISLNVAAGEIVGLLGPNGAGKSTTFRMLCGLLRPTSGECLIDGVDMLHSSSAARNRIGYMAQKFSLYKDVSVWQNIYISGRLYGLGRKRIADFGRMLTRALDLETLLGRPAGSLPPGLKQKLALICATIHQPPVLFLDEPTSGVDLRTRRDFWKHIAALTNAGTAVLVTTHFMEEAEYCDRIALLYHGHMIEYGTPGELQRKTASPDMERAFIACIEKYDREKPSMM